MVKSIIKTLKEVCGVGLLAIGIAIVVFGGIFEASIPQALAGVALIAVSFLFVTPKRLAQLVVDGIIGTNP